MAPRRITSAIRTHNSRRLALRIPDNYPISYKLELFEPCLEFQRRSNNLVFYDRAQGAVVEYP